MPNKITDTGILNKAYNGRSLIVHRSSTEPLVRASDGTLYAAVRTGNQMEDINIFQSNDNGFSWEKKFTASLYIASQAGFNHNGSHVFLQLFEEFGSLVILHAYYTTIPGRWEIQYWNFDLNNEYEEVNSEGFNVDQDFEAFTAAYNDNRSFMICAKFGDLTLYTFQITDPLTVSETIANNGPYFNVMDAEATDDGYVHVAALCDVTTVYRIHYRRFDSNATSFSTAVTVYDSGSTADITDLNISRDGYGNLVIMWGEMNGAGTALSVKYSLSLDNGVTWSSPTTVPLSTGHVSFTDTATGQMAARADCIGGLEGFIMTYARLASGVSKTFVRQLTTEDGVTYTLGAEAQIATQVASSTDEVAGAVFFKPPAAKLLDLSNPGNVRIGYQIGQGNSTNQSDTKPIRVGQELLSQSAYPSTLSIDEEEYLIDNPGGEQILVTVNVVGSPTNNIDFYALGVTGPTTSRYIAAFEKVGTNMLVLQYEPVQSSMMNDRSAYSEPEENIVKVLLAPMTYESVLADRGADNFTAFVERDVRKLYLPPDFHLGRTFLLNEGNYLKRTVWTVWFDGNEYELSQVVPFFLKNTICYYTANAYVIGASYDPFSKRILPSET